MRRRLARDRDLPSCWDGKTLDSPDHKTHIAYPASGTFESGGACPSTHPVKIPQIMYEIMFSTQAFADKSLWPTDGSQPFYWSMSDHTGYGIHGDYLFGWKGDALQRAMDSKCAGDNCRALTRQADTKAVACTKGQVAHEDIGDSCKRPRSSSPCWLRWQMLTHFTYRDQGPARPGRVDLLKPSLSFLS